MSEPAAPGLKVRGVIIGLSAIVALVAASAFLLIGHRNQPFRTDAVSSAASSLAADPGKRPS
jgi:hypothetical protein